MAITVTGETTHGTFEELMGDIRKLNDSHGIISIKVTYGKHKKPLLALISRMENYDEEQKS